jgi:hypothetical protein
MLPFPRALFLCLLLALGGGSASAIVIISPEGSVNNGGFEDSAYTPWVRNSDNTNILITNNAANAFEGSKYLTVEKLFVDPYWTNGAQNTGYAITSGDRFELSFYAKALNGAAASNTIGWTLFYTSNNLIGGTRTTVAGGASLALTSTYQQTTFTMPTAVAEAAVGKSLFLVLYSDNLSNNAVSAVDNVYLATVPEPSATGFLALGLGAVLWRTRRRRSGSE